uniref:Uncharacterized protein n=1 Tax=Romanomermis culicivorax TaxID=13658 RepID=A0A915K7H5_ROMCU
MWVATFLVSLAVCYATVVANNAVEETSNEQRSKEAIRLWLISDHLNHMLVEKTIPESELQIGKNLFNQVCIGDPEFDVALVNNSTVDKARAQSMITGNIGKIDTTVVAHDPRSISWFYGFCKVAFNDVAYAGLTMWQCYQVEMDAWE